MPEHPGPVRSRPLGGQAPVDLRVPRRQLGGVEQVVGGQRVGFGVVFEVTGQDVKDTLGVGAFRPPLLFGECSAGPVVLAQQFGRFVEKRNVRDRPTV